MSSPEGQGRNFGLAPGEGYLDEWLAHRWHSIVRPHDDQAPDKGDGGIPWLRQLGSALEGSPTGTTTPQGCLDALAGFAAGAALNSDQPPADPSVPEMPTQGDAT